MSAPIKQMGNGLIEIDSHTALPVIIDVFEVRSVCPLPDGELDGRQANTLITFKGLQNKECVVVMTEYNLVKDGINEARESADPFTGINTFLEEEKDGPDFADL
jgi:hypothetical protein